MRDPKNIVEVANSAPDYLGFILYPKSKRNVNPELLPELFKAIPEKIQKVGVFVNESIDQIIKIAKVGLNVIQLHGQETPDICNAIKKSGFTVFKAFSIDDAFDFNMLEAYKGTCDYFLFDTKGNLPGGTGQKFKWQILEKYHLDIPFFLSGGITPDDVENICNFKHAQLLGLDINSGFEISPALKNIEKVKHFITEIHSA